MTRRAATLVLAAATAALAAFALLGAAASGGVRSEEAGAEPTDLAPLQCYVRARDQSTISSLSAKQLCLGAVNLAPADCFDLAKDLLDSSDSDALTLCQGAPTTEPATCAKRLEDDNRLGTPMIVSYCAAQRWPIVAAPQSGDPACIKTALDETTLSNDQAAQLCGGSVSVGPVGCYQWGRDQTTLSNDDLIQLCAKAAIAAPTYLTP